MPNNQLNVFGKELELCCSSPVTGAYRDGYCNTGTNDIGTHTVCAIVTDKFLQFSKSKGNDLTTPNPFYNFKGLKQGDKWCLCVSRWLEAFELRKLTGTQSLIRTLQRNISNNHLSGYFTLENPFLTSIGFLTVKVIPCFFEKFVVMSNILFVLC